MFQDTTPLAAESAALLKINLSAMFEAPVRLRGEQGYY